MLMANDENYFFVFIKCRFKLCQKYEYCNLCEILLNFDYPLVYLFIIDRKE